jgi:hypothetical protein
MRTPGLGLTKAPTEPILQQSLILAKILFPLIWSSFQSLLPQKTKGLKVLWNRHLRQNGAGLLPKSNKRNAPTAPYPIGSRSAASTSTAIER